MTRLSKRALLLQQPASERAITSEHERLSERLALLSRSYLSLMITRNVEPIGHISPYPRIDLSPVRRASAESRANSSAKSRGMSAIEESRRTAEIERIWRLIVQAAEAN